MKVSFVTQAWVLEICRKHALKVAKLEGITGLRAEYFKGVLEAAVQTNALCQPHEDAIRDLIKRGRE